jgi:hypothetical protein
LEVEKERRVPHSSFLIILSFALVSLRAWAFEGFVSLNPRDQQGGERFLVSDLSLVKVVKDPTLTILLSFRFILEVYCEERVQIGSFSAGWVHC